LTFRQIGVIFGILFPLPKKIMTRIKTWVAVLLLVCGCKTTSTVTVNNRLELLYNSDPGLFTFKQGYQPPFAPRDIVKALKKAGVQSGVEIRIHMGDFYDQIFIEETTKSLANGGFQPVTFCKDPTAFSHGSFLRPFDRPPATAPARQEP